MGVSKRKSAARAFLFSEALLVAFFGVVYSIAAPVAMGQAVASGNVAGQILYPQNAAVVGAVITLTDKATGTSRTTESNETGRYQFTQVPPGDYDLIAVKEGFAQTKVANQKVSVGLDLTINVPLKLGATSQTVEVTSTPGAELQISNATMGTTMHFDQINALPNQGRDTSALATLQPGVTPTGQTGGLQSDQNTYQLDGGNISDDMAGTNATYTPSFTLNAPVSTGGSATGVVPTPVESIEEVKVNVSNQTADFNSSGGSQVQMVTKRGTNQYHGSLYEYYLDTKIGQANTWDNLRLGPGPCTAFGKNSAGNATCVSTPSAHRSRFGGSVGGTIGPKFLGGKTYFFANYEGFRYPLISNLEFSVPSPTLRAGLIGFKDPGGTSYFNLNPYPVTVNGVTYQPSGTGGAPGCGASGTGACDPRGIGINTQFVQKIWNTMMPLPNDPSFSTTDTINTQGYIAPVRLPSTSNFGVLRLDHDFGQKWHWMGSYRYYRLVYQGTQQVDIGGVLPGDTFGTGTSLIHRPVAPSFYVTGLTTNFSSSITNDLHYSFTRNFWLWDSALAPPQFAGLGAALEIGGETTPSPIGSALIPYNVNAQSVRERFWDGKDHQVRDDVSWLRGNHLIQFGGLFQHNENIHQRDDNGVQTFTSPVYISGGSQSASMLVPAAAQPPICPAGNASAVNCIPTSALATNTWRPLYEEVLGIITYPQVIYSRSGSNFTLNNPPNQPVTSEVSIPTYNLYVGDTWHLRPSLTVSYGLAYTIEMPPFDVTNTQTMLVNATGQPVTTDSFMNTRQAAALAGQNYLPTLGYELISNTGRKYAYDPYYKGISPHASAAWNPNFDSGILGHVFGHNSTVIRGGWSRIFGRLNGVDLVLVPLLGAGPLQVVTCPGAVNAAAVAGGATQCAGASNPTTAFRIGTDGNTAPLPAVTQTLAQPNLTGISPGSPITGDTSQLDPFFKPNRSDEFALTIQRQLPGKMLLEFGYVGRRLRNEYQAIQLSSVPYMMTLGGQQFVTAFDNLYFKMTGLTPNSSTVSGTPLTSAGITAACGTGALSCPIPTQPFFENSLVVPAGTPGSVNLNGLNVSSYCSGFVSCSAAVASKQFSNISTVTPYSLWANGGVPMTFGSASAIPTLYATNQLASVSMETSDGWGNYNAAIVSLVANNFHGMTLRSNFTWGRAMGTGDYTQSTSSTSVVDPFNLQRAYGPQSYDFRFLYNLSMLYQPPFYKGQHGVMGKLLGGWSFAPIFTANSGAPRAVGNVSSFSASTYGEVPSNLGAFDEAELVTHYTQGNSAHLGVTGSNGIGTNNPTGINIFSDPAAAFAMFTSAVPGVYNNIAGAGILRGLPTWNLDATVSKDVLFTERIGATFVFQFSNVLNHVQYGNPSLNLGVPTQFGRITSSTGLVRQLEMGIRVHF